MKKTYHTIGSTTTEIAAPLGFITAYWAIRATYQRSQQGTPRQGWI